jgi:hypothetical protein
VGMARIGHALVHVRWSLPARGDPRWPAVARVESAPPPHSQLQDDEAPARSRDQGALRAARAAERALRDGSGQAPRQADDVELAGVARRPRRAAEAQLDVGARRTAHLADYLRRRHAYGLGPVDGNEDVALADLCQGAAGLGNRQRLMHMPTQGESRSKP